MFELFALATLMMVAALLAWSGLRVWRTKNGFIKWGGTGLATLLSAIVTLISLITANGLFKLHARSAPATVTNVEGTPEQIQRGKAISDGFCSACHSKTGTLTGGLDIGEHFPMPIGSFVSSNLTPVGQVSNWSDGDIFRAIRNSVDPNGRWLIIMSYTNAGKLSDEDIRAVIAYIRSLSAIGKPTDNPPDHLNLLGIAMLGAGMLPTGKPVSISPITAPSAGSTLLYGEYILSYQDCRACHGAKLTGGVPGQLGPLGPDLNLVKGWKLEQFIATMRTGVDPDGHELGKEMPWQPIGRMSDEELSAVYQYLTHLPNS
ncbi:mono/diheme cytochrome c family protein [Bradyrhizobium sp. AZCC 2262]|uniref:cytochrome c n=1 Tax=Bradyrhizobium sp. AZCC 2262 TaxID=3117022 RepID=UPI002FF0AA6C